MDSAFDWAFQKSDTAAFKVMATDKNAVLYNITPASGTPVTIIDQPSDTGEQFRAGGKVRDVAIELEILTSEFNEAQAATGWKIEFKGEHYRIARLRPQGGTITLVCGDLADTTTDDW